MDKRYQVFVSSTYEDLQEERKEVMQALLELDCIPAGMELFPASNDDQWTLIKRVIDDCDYYLLIIGGRYGSINDEGVSYTQMEFEYALASGKPIVSFLPKNPADIAIGKCESTSEGKAKLEEFKTIAQKKLVKYWSNAQDLGSVVSRSVVKLIKDFPAAGWVKADNIVNNEDSLKDILKLQKENEALKIQLQNTKTQAPKGSEKLAQGEDFVEVGLSFSAEDEEHAYTCEPKIKTTWNDIFYYISPYLIDECKEFRLKKLLDDYIKEFEDEIKDREAFKNLTNFRNFSINKDDFNIIKIQFKALGLIKLSDRKRGVKDATDYWTLTEYGDHVMTQLVAIKKDENY